MSWKTINRILGRASIDPEFQQALQQDPLTTLEAEGFELSSEEQAAITEFARLPFAELCQRLLEKLAPGEWY